MKEEFISECGGGRIRQLIDGSFVAEAHVGWWIFKRWKALSRISGILWDRHYYQYCKVNSIEEAKKLLACLGF